MVGSLVILAGYNGGLAGLAWLVGVLVWLVVVWLVGWSGLSHRCMTSTFRSANCVGLIGFLVWLGGWLNQLVCLVCLLACLDCLAS